MDGGTKSPNGAGLPRETALSTIPQQLEVIEFTYVGNGKKGQTLITAMGNVTPPSGTEMLAVVPPYFQLIYCFEPCRQPLN